MGKNMYELSNKLDEARDAAKLEAVINETEVKDYLGDVLGAVEGSDIEKAKEVALLYKDSMAFMDSVSTEIKRLNAIKKEYKEETDRMKEWVNDLLDGEKIKDADVMVKYNTSKAIKLNVEPEDLPEEYQKVKVEADKRQLTADIKKGVDLEKYALLEESNNISIK